jgi:hypothetical protein
LPGSGIACSFNSNRPRALLTFTFFIVEPPNSDYSATAILLVVGILPHGRPLLLEELKVGGAGSSGAVEESGTLRGEEPVFGEKSTQRASLFTRVA